MSLLRIRCDFVDEPLACQWVFLEAGHEPVAGEGVPSAERSSHADQVQLILPAAQVLFTRIRLPEAARRHTAQVLAFAVEDETLREPDANQVSLLGRAGDEDMLAVVDRRGLNQCVDALSAAGARVHEVYCETLLLPWMAGEWSLAWNGRDGFLRTGELEGVAVDCGDGASPPLSLLLMLEEAGREKPASIELYMASECVKSGSDVPPDPGSTLHAGSMAGSALVSVGGAVPDTEAWQRTLGIPVSIAGTWDWRSPSLQPGFNLLPAPRRGQLLRGLLPRLRPAVWLVAAALIIHLAALISDWAMLDREQRALRQQMETRFRQLFPGAALVDPALQMRRKLAEARHAAGVPDGADFLPMLEAVAGAVQRHAAGGLRTISYEKGKMTLELAVEEASGQSIAADLEKAGLVVDAGPVSAEGSGNLVLMVSAL